MKLFNKIIEFLKNKLGLDNSSANNILNIFLDSWENYNGSVFENFNVKDYRTMLKLLKIDDPWYGDDLIDKFNLHKAQYEKSLDVEPALQRFTKSPEKIELEFMTLLNERIENLKADYVSTITEEEREKYQVILDNITPNGFKPSFYNLQIEDINSYFQFLDDVLDEDEKLDFILNIALGRSNYLSKHLYISEAVTEEVKVQAEAIIEKNKNAEQSPTPEELDKDIEEYIQYFRENLTGGFEIEEDVQIAFNQIPVNYPITFNEREKYYKAINKPLKQYKLVYLDVEKNIIPNVYSSNIIDKIEFAHIIEYCQGLKEKADEIQKKEDPIQNDNMTDQQKIELVSKYNNINLDMYLEIKNFSKRIKEYAEKNNISSNFNEEIYILGVSNADLEDAIECYEMAIIINDIAQINKCYNEMKEKYEEMLYQENEFLESIEAAKTMSDYKTKEESYLDLGMDFYPNRKAIKNLLIFLPDESGSSYALNDLLNDSNIKEYINLFTDSCNEYIAGVGIGLDNPYITKAHAAQNRSRYQDITEEFRIRGLSNKHNIRTYCGWYHSRINQINPFYPNAEHIAFVVGVGYGATSEKNDTNSKMLKRVNDNQDYMREIIKLFDTKFDELSPKEREEKEQRINDIIKQNLIMLGEIKAKEEEKKQKKSKSKKGLEDDK